jgi:hypothetical protein
MSNNPDIHSFLEEGFRRLAPYVAGVPDFLDRATRQTSFKESVLRSRPPEAYLRNMLAVGVVNRLHREAFLETTAKIIVLPDCLKNFGDWDCSKEDEGNAHLCSQCRPECLVYETVERFADDRTRVVLEPEDMKKYFGDIRTAEGTVGVVGVACVLTLLSGFQATLCHRHPTQGIFLNYSSCAHHWADPPYNTSYSLARMAFILGAEDRDDPETVTGKGETYSLERAPGSPAAFYAALDELAELFVDDYLTIFTGQKRSADLFELSDEVCGAIVPDIITRDSA